MRCTFTFLGSSKRSTNCSAEQVPRCPRCGQRRLGSCQALAARRRSGRYALISASMSSAVMGGVPLGENLNRIACILATRAVASLFSRDRFDRAGLEQAFGSGLLGEDIGNRDLDGGDELCPLRAVMIVGGDQGEMPTAARQQRPPATIQLSLCASVRVFRIGPGFGGTRSAGCRRRTLGTAGETAPPSEP